MEDERRHCDRRAVTTLLYDGFLVREFSRPASYCVTTPGTPVLGSVARFWGARCQQPSSPTATDNSDDDDGGDCGGREGMRERAKACADRRIVEKVGLTIPPYDVIHFENRPLPRGPRPRP